MQAGPLDAELAYVLLLSSPKPMVICLSVSCLPPSLFPSLPPFLPPCPLPPAPLPLPLPFPPSPRPLHTTTLLCSSSIQTHKHVTKHILTRRHRLSSGAMVDFARGISGVCVCVCVCLCLCLCVCVCVCILHTVDCQQGFRTRRTERERENFGRRETKTCKHNTCVMLRIRK